MISDQSFSPRMVVAPHLMALLVSLFMSTGTAAQEFEVRTAVEDWRIGGMASVPEYTFSVEPRVVAGPDELLYVRTDRHTVSVFDTLGQFVRRIGRRGGGPGEFRGISAHGFVGDTLWIYERPPRIARFLPDGTHLRTNRHHLPSWEGQAGVFPNAVALVAGGRVLLQPPRYPHGLEYAEGPLSLPVPLGEIGGSKWDTIAYAPAPRGIVVAYAGHSGAILWEPIPRTPLIEVAPDGSRITVASWSDHIPGELRIKVLHPGGSAAWARNLVVRPRKIPPAVRDSLFEYGLERVERILELRHRAGKPTPRSARPFVERGLYLPKYYPPASRLFFGTDGKLWVQVSLTEDRTSWFVVGSEGSPSFQVHLPADVDVRQASGTRIWGVAPGQYDTDYVVQFSILPQ